MQNDYRTLSQRSEYFRIFVNYKHLIEKGIFIVIILNASEIRKKTFEQYTDTLTMQIIIFLMHQRNIRILRDPIANGADAG